jgi:hypothetical protein
MLAQDVGPYAQAGELPRVELIRSLSGLTYRPAFAERQELG